MDRYYVFNPDTNLFLCWNGTWQKFSGAKDFLNISDALDAATATGIGPITFIFQLRS